MSFQEARRNLGERFSEAARLLWRAVEREGISLTEAARRAGMSTGQFSHLIYGDRVPTIESANRIAEQWPAVEVSLWTAAPSRSFTPPAAREEAS